MKALIVVDMQNDFIDGVLGTEEAEAIVEAVACKIRDWEGDIYVTMDTHDERYDETQEGRNLPVAHCIRNTLGWELHPQVKAALEEKKAAGVHVETVCKPSFGSRELAEMLSEPEAARSVEEICLAGVCTDICVISNAMLLKAFLPEVPMVVDASCCAGVTPKAHKNALEAMKACQIRVEGEIQ